MNPPGYAIVRKIASGGMGTVYLARRAGVEGFARLVALKRAHGDLANDPAYKRRLVHEASAASRIHHVNVVSVIDVVEDKGELWLVLEWVDGLSLSNLQTASPRGRLPPSVGARLVLDACTGLAAAHELVDEAGAPAGLRHRDVSPQNILVGRDGVARLADFGLAKASDATLTATTDRMVEGKLGYVAPELFSGKPFDAGCDLYAIAVVAWEVLAGRRLFKGRNLRELSSEQANVPLLSSVDPDLGAFDRALAAALSVDPSRRPESVRAFVVELEAAAKRLGLLATPLDVAHFVLRTLHGTADAEEPARTPTTGPLDPSWTPAGRISTTIVTTGGLEDAPTPIAPEEVVATLVPPTPEASPQRVDSEPPVPTSPLPKRRRGALIVVVGGLVIASASAFAIARTMSEEPKRASGAPSASAAASAMVLATAIASAATAPPPTDVTPAPEVEGSSSSSGAVVDLDAASTDTPVAAQEASSPHGPRIASRKTAAPAELPPAPAEPTGVKVPKNPYRKDSTK